MLIRALDVKERLNKFVREHRPENTLYRPQEDRLTPKDWIFINRLQIALDCFNAATLSTKGHRP